MTEKIIVSGAREHNLKNIDLEIPRDKLIVFTGISGSGKSSLAFDAFCGRASAYRTAPNAAGRYAARPSIR